MSSEINAIIGGAPDRTQNVVAKVPARRGCDCRKIGVKCTVGFCLCDPCKCKNFREQAAVVSSNLVDGNSYNDTTSDGSTEPEVSIYIIACNKKLKL